MNAEPAVADGSEELGIRHYALVLLRLDRDSVAASDDVESHDEVREVDGRWQWVVAELVRDRYLPSIQGGRACWILRTSRRGDALGVVRIRYGEFDGLRLISDDNPSLADVSASLFFEYATQEDPNDVFARL